MLMALIPDNILSNNKNDAKNAAVFKHFQLKYLILRETGKLRVQVSTRGKTETSRISTFARKSFLSHKLLFIS